MVTATTATENIFQSSESQMFFPLGERASLQPKYYNRIDKFETNTVNKMLSEYLICSFASTRFP